MAKSMIAGWNDAVRLVWEGSGHRRRKGGLDGRPDVKGLGGSLLAGAPATAPCANCRPAADHRHPARGATRHAAPPGTRRHPARGATRHAASTIGRTSTATATATATALPCLVSGGALL